MCDRARVNPIRLCATHCRCGDEGSRNVAMGAVELMYPTTGRVRPATVSQYMYYESIMNELSEAIQPQQKAIETRQEVDELTGSTVKTPQSWWQRQMLAQGPWDEINDPDFFQAFKGEPKLLKGAPSLPVSVVNSDQERPDKSFSRSEGGKPDTSYPKGEQSYNLFKSQTSFMDPHATTRLAACHGIYAPRSKRSIKAENGRPDNYEM